MDDGNRGDWGNSDVTRMAFLEARKNTVAFDFVQVTCNHHLTIRTKFPIGFWRVRFKGNHMANKFATLRDAIDSEIKSYERQTL